MADTYLHNTLYTNYAFRKLAKNFGNDGSLEYPYSPYNLITIKIGNGDNSSNLDKISLSRTLYTLNVINTKVSTSSITFECVIPEELEGVNITEIGLFDVNVNTGEEYLFSYSRVDTIKPADIDYKLSIELDLTLRTINYHPEKLRLKVNKEDVATREMYDKLEEMFLYIETNLERIIDYNSNEIGRNLPQTYYLKEKDINCILSGYTYADKHFNLYNKFDRYLRDAFFIKQEKYLMYSINDMCNDSAFISVYENAIISNGDKISFNGECAFSVTVKAGNFIDNIQLVNKISENNVNRYFTLEIVDKNILKFSLYLPDEIYSFTKELTNDELYLLTDSYTTITIVYDGNNEAPRFKLFLNGVHKEINQPTDIKLNNLEEHTEYPIRNYLETSDGMIIGESINIQNIIFINRQITDSEVHLLYTLQKVRNI